MVILVYPARCPKLTLDRKANGHSLDEIPYKATFGIWGAWVNVIISTAALIASFYVALYPVGPPDGYLNVQNFFEAYLAAPLLIFLYLVWKVYSWFARPEDRPLWIPINKIDIYSGMRELQRTSISDMTLPEDQRRASINQMQQEKEKHGAMDWIKTGMRNVF